MLLKVCTLRNFMSAIYLMNFATISFEGWSTMLWVYVYNCGYDRIMKNIAIFQSFVRRGLTS